MQPNFTFLPDELDLIVALQDAEEVFESTPLLAASIKDALEDPKAKSILYYLLTLLPRYLQSVHELDFSSALEKKILPNKAAYENVFDPFLSSLAKAKIANTDTLRVALAPTKFKTLSKKSFLILSEFLVTNKQKIFSYLNPDAKAYFKKLYSLYTSEELEEKDLQFIQRNAVKLQDVTLRKLIQSINSEQDLEEKPTDSTSHANKYSLAKSTEESIAKTLFKGKDVHDVTICKKLQLSQPEKFKEWRKATLQVRKAAKVLLQEAWEAQGYNVEPVEKAHFLLKKLKIADPIDKGFVGKVSLVPTGTTLFTYYTKAGLELASIVGQNVEMNTKYDAKTDNTYYCSHIPFISDKGKPIKIYTKKHGSGSSQRLHQAAKDLADNIESIRTTMIDDSQLLLKGEKSTKAILALVGRVLDVTAGRVGNPRSENRETPTYGIHNLQLRHISIKANSVTMKYLGKKEVPQKHLIEDEQIIQAITFLAKGRKPKQYVFSLTGDKPVADKSVNNYLATFGIDNFTAHSFRKLKANASFTRAMKDSTIKDPLKLFDKITLAVGEALGHASEGAVAIASYISPLLLDAFFKKHKIKMPKKVAAAIEKHQGEGKKDE
jgi:hypothetical protein